MWHVQDQNKQGWEEGASNCRGAWPRPPCQSPLLYWNLLFSNYDWQKRRQAEFGSQKGWLSMWVQGENGLYPEIRPDSDDDPEGQW